jgi:AraC family transcriptional regulator
MRHRGGYMGVHAVWERLRTWALARDLLSHGPALYGICPDDPDVTHEALLRFDACVVVGPNHDAAFDDQVIEASVPAGTYAVGLHVGPYSRLSDTYLDVIGHWFPTSGYALAPDAVVEHYLNDPSDTPTDELRTEVRVRIA